ncbi:hypothetical protein [Sphingomonas alpina]|uniref:Uncharacterized protein n=1 Tax=Sphingomonas alpina TaxID=653931 RepID=A0A7H0LHX2_9SPHN|nr:hypothetical protein [Sphingomonas alpina]QNQ09275.1 hypothetical protein H3Z74_21815 [Sphingomonas alpina]
MSSLGCPSYGWDRIVADAPEVTPLWERTHVAHKAGKTCEVCKAPIEIGEKYQSSGMIYEGDFSVWLRHQYAEHFPSGCPKLRPRDLAEIERDSEGYP